MLIYDGFNDCRMNNCSPGIFRDDYSHCIWYRGFERRRKAGAVVLPLDIVNDLTETIGLGTPDVNALQYGNKLKTPGPFRHNLEEIVTAAAKQHAAVVLQTFAYHIPENYTEEKFAKEELDYGDRGGLKRCELKMWGLADNVLACVQAHNEVIRNLSEKYPDDAVFIDQQRLMAGKGELFIDPCHFSKSGTRQFVDNLLPLVVKRLREKQSDSRK